jgi:hypothetical protein
LRKENAMGVSLRIQFAHAVSWLYLASLYLFLPVIPLFAGIVFWRLKFITNYRETLRKCLGHVNAMREGPAFHYFSDVVGHVKRPPDDIYGSCVQCGNCCMDHRCAFLESIDGDRFRCGIYNSYWRRFSNCSSFPLHQQDIDRYACPSYFVRQEVSIRIYKKKDTCLAASTYS